MADSKKEFKFLANDGAEAIIERINFIRDLIKSSPDVFSFKPELLEKTKQVLLKAGGDDDEEYQDEDAGDDFQNYGMDDEDLQELDITDDPFSDEDDEASKWLSEHGEEGAEKPSPKAAPAAASEGDEEEAEPTEEAPEAQAIKKPRSSGYADWAPHGQYTPEQKATMEQHKKLGYSDREAEHLAGASRMPKDFQSALSHTVRPSQPSEKMLGELRELASHWLDRADRHAKINADPEKNPQKFASGKMMQAHEAGTKDYNKAYNDFLGSDEVKSKKGLDRHKAIQNWKADWKKQNPDYHEKLVTGMSEAGKHFGEANQARTKNINDLMAHIITGGHQEGAMSASEGAQHVGGAKSDEGYSSTVIKDPSATFAHSNPELVEKLRQKLQPEQMDRYHRVQSARATQGVKPQVVRRPKPSEGGGQGET